MSHSWFLGLVAGAVLAVDYSLFTACCSLLVSHFAGLWLRTLNFGCEAPESLYIFSKFLFHTFRYIEVGQTDLINEIFTNNYKVASSPMLLFPNCFSTMLTPCCSPGQISFRAIC